MSNKIRIANLFNKKITINYLFILIFFVPQSNAQSRADIGKQVYFDKFIPAGNYSGITKIDENKYALVSDKTVKDGFYIFKINIDSISGNILSITDCGFRSDTVGCRDAEGITWIHDTQTLLIVGESDNRILEYDINGKLTGRQIQLDNGIGNLSYESLSYCPITKKIWTCTENSKDGDYYIPNYKNRKIIRIQSFNLNLCKTDEYAYILDLPKKNKNKQKYHAHGVSEILALDNSSLLVLEREFVVPKNKIGASVSCKLYEVFPSMESSFTSINNIGNHPVPMQKKLITKWNTKFTLFGRSLANYEGMCLGPNLSDGSRLIIMVSDSQNRYKGFLHDWFRIIKIKN